MYESTEKKGSVICVFSPESGSGQSSFAALLSMFLSLKGERTLAVSFENDPYSMVDLLDGGLSKRRLDEAVRLSASKDLTPDGLETYLEELAKGLYIIKNEQPITNKDALFDLMNVACITFDNVIFETRDKEDIGKSDIVFNVFTQSSSTLYTLGRMKNDRIFEHENLVNIVQKHIEEHPLSIGVIEKVTGDAYPVDFDPAFAKAIDDRDIIKFLSDSHIIATAGRKGLFKRSGIEPASAYLDIRDLIMRIGG